MIVKQITSLLHHSNAPFHSVLRPSDTRLMRAIGIVICIGFIFILAFNFAERLVEKNRGFIAQHFEELTNANFELGTISQRIALMLFGMLGPRDITLQSKLSEEVLRELERMQQAGKLIKSQSLSPNTRLSLDARESLEKVTETSRQFIEMSQNLLEVISTGTGDRTIVGQFADQAASVLTTSRGAIRSLSADAVRSAKADETLELILFTLSMTATLVTGLVVILFVILRLKRALESLRLTEAQLVRTNNDLERFSSIVAHDLNGPLNNISLGTKLLGERTSDIPQVQELIETIGRETSRLGKIIQALLRLSRTQCSSLSVQAIDIPKLIEEVKSGIALKLEESAGIIRYNGLQTMRGDHALLQSLFQNLIENSVRYRRDEATPVIEILSSHQHDHVQFIYQDNGRGIPISERENVFEPFVQLNGGNTGQGLGLGLSLVKRIVLAHGGQIFITDHDGFGTCFVILIPRRLS